MGFPFLIGAAIVGGIAATAYHNSNYAKEKRAERREEERMRQFEERMRRSEEESRRREREAAARREKIDALNNRITPARESFSKQRALLGQVLNNTQLVKITNPDAATNDELFDALPDRYSSLTLRNSGNFEKLMDNNANNKSYLLNQDVNETLRVFKHVCPNSSVTFTDCAQKAYNTYKECDKAEATLQDLKAQLQETIAQLNEDDQAQQKVS